MEKFTANEKIAIVMESYTANNIAELCRRYGVSASNFNKWRDKFIESGKNWFHGLVDLEIINTRKRMNN